MSELLRGEGGEGEGGEGGVPALALLCSLQLQTNLLKFLIRRSESFVTRPQTRNARCRFRHVEIAFDADSRRLKYEPKYPAAQFETLVLHQRSATSAHQPTCGDVEGYMQRFI